MKRAKIHMITGGQRSGKSEFAEKLTLERSERPLYLATSKIWDEEYKDRIDVHRSRRGKEWRTIEEEKELAELTLDGETVLLDCITLWLTNIFDAVHYDKDAALKFAREQWDEILKKNTELIVVGNEIGLGVISMDKGTRSFVDAHGLLNQYIASTADEVTLMVSGIPVKIKP